MKTLILLLLFPLLSYAQTYTSHLTKIDSARKQYKNLYDQSTNKDSILTLAGKYIEKELTQTMYKQWEGTKWDFNGYTNIPKTGTIACGYYVSTNLKHIGFKINRYRMAQQSSMSEVKTLDPHPKIHRGDYVSFITYAKTNLKDGLYIIGLSSHVGMLQKEGDQIYLLHSSPVGPVAVTKEPLDKCEVLTWSDIFVVGEISNNKDLIKKWLNDTVVNVKMD